MITIVSGLPRSGTSLMMQILAASGYDMLTDNVRLPDENNLNGYYEYEKVKSLKTDNTWLPEAEGKTVKIISQLLPFLSPDFNYCIFYMERNIDEVICSQNKMLNRLQKSSAAVSPEAIKKVFIKQSESVKAVFSTKPTVRFHVVSFNKLVMLGPEEISALTAFSENKITEQIVAAAVNPELYREKITPSA